MKRRRVVEVPKAKTGISIEEEVLHKIDSLAVELRVGRSAIIDFILTTNVDSFNKDNFINYFFKG